MYRVHQLSQGPTAPARLGGHGHYERKGMSSPAEMNATGRGRMLLAAVAATIALCFALASGPVAKSDAAVINFCSSVSLAPFGQAGDRCFAGHDHWGHIMYSTIQTFERAGCVNYAGWYYELYASWKCVGKNSTTYIYVPNDGGSYQGVIRNNNSSYSGKFSGSYTCCW